MGEALGVSPRRETVDAVVDRLESDYSGPTGLAALPCTGVRSSAPDSIDSTSEKPKQEPCMPSVNGFPLRNLADIEKFETEKAFEQRCSARSIYDLFAQSAARYPDQTALTMIMTGEAGETPRRVSYHELLDRITRAANLFHDIAGPRPGVAFMLPNLIETHVTLWGAETAGYAVPINFLQKAEHIAELVRAAGARVLVALGPDPQLDIWDKATEVASLLPEIKLVQVSAPDVRVPAGAIGFAAALEQHNGSRLDFGAAGKDDDVAAYFHTGGTTGTPKLVTHTHRGQIVAAFGGAALLDLSETDTMTNGLPLFHVAGTIGSVSCRSWLAPKCSCFRRRACEIRG